MASPLPRVDPPSAWQGPLVQGPARIDDRGTGPMGKTGPGPVQATRAPSTERTEPEV